MFFSMFLIGDDCNVFIRRWLQCCNVFAMFQCFCNVFIRRWLQCFCNVFLRRWLQSQITKPCSYLQLETEQSKGNPFLVVLYLSIIRFVFVCIQFYNYRIQFCICQYSVLYLSILRTMTCCNTMSS